jgi:hypothetical protein
LLCSALGIERQKDPDVALVPLSISSSWLSVVVPLPAKGLRETKGGTIGCGGGGDLRFQAKNGDGCALERGVSVNVR